VWARHRTLDPLASSPSSVNRTVYIKRCGDFHPRLSKGNGVIRIHADRQCNIRVPVPSTAPVTTETTNCRGMSVGKQWATDCDKQLGTYPSTIHARWRRDDIVARVAERGWSSRVTAKPSSLFRRSTDAPTPPHTQLSTAPPTVRNTHKVPGRNSDYRLTSLYTPLVYVYTKEHSH
jgi:hypothetical protein